MKKLMLFAALLVAMTVNAQRRVGTVTIQPKLGGTIAWLSNTPSINLGEYDSYLKGITLDKSVMAGFVIGAELEYQFTDIVSLAAGVNYSMQGSGWKDTDIKDASTGTTAHLKNLEIDLGYINVPIVANVYIFNGFAVKAGVQFGFMTNANIKGEVSGKIGNLTLTKSVDEDYKSACKKFDFSIPVGVSYEFKVPIVLDLRYNIGVTKVNKYDEGFGDMRNNVFQLTCGYRFNL